MKHRLVPLAMFATALASMSCPAASAGPRPAAGDGALPGFVRSEDGARSCWRSESSDAERVAEPFRTVTSVALAMETDVVAPDADWPQGRTLYNYELSIVFADGRQGRALGNCLARDAKTITCAVECDGGGAVVSLGEDGAVAADFEPLGGMRLQYCGEPGDGLRFQPKAGETRFVLQRRPEAECPPVSMPDWDAGID